MCLQNDVDEMLPTPPFSLWVPPQFPRRSYLKFVPRSVLTYRPCGTGIYTTLRGTINRSLYCLSPRVFPFSFLYRFCTSLGALDPHGSFLLWYEYEYVQV